MRCMCIVELSASPLEAHPERLLALHDRLTAEPGLAVPLRMDVTLQLSILSFEYENLDSPTGCSNYEHVQQSLNTGTFCLPVLFWT